MQVDADPENDVSDQQLREQNFTVENSTLVKIIIKKCECQLIWTFFSGS